MAVLKSKRKQSRLEVIHNYYKLRDAMTFKLFNNFGYREYHAERRISHKYFNNVPRHELSLPEQQIFAERLELSNKIFEEYIVAERKHLLQALRELGGYIVGANGIWPTIEEEAIERRLLQDRALVKCNEILTELNSALRTLPVTASSYSEVSELLKKEICLIKGWRQSDNSRRKALSKSASNFANVNGNGNANCNNASNVNGVRPDFQD